uniref:Uncharacterized protein n=1 Tax=Heterorhabditis bacteriophora TaxID=37862 RepID=A0A1I7WGN2_HETBA
MWQNEKEDMFLAVMAVLLILLSAVIWIAFCVAVKKTASKFIELKRQRRREFLRNQTELPSYEQALSMSCTPSPNPPLAMTTQNERIAPDRPGALPTIVLPPSYDSAVRSDLQITTPTSSTTSSIYSISSNLAITVGKYVVGRLIKSNLTFTNTALVFICRTHSPQ